MFFVLFVIVLYNVMYLLYNIVSTDNMAVYCCDILIIYNDRVLYCYIIYNVFYFFLFNIIIL